MTRFAFTFRNTDIAEFTSTTKETLDSRDNELELYLRLADPVGRIVQWHTTTIPVPDGWLRCNGASVTVSRYNALFKVIGYTYGGSGANFTLPTVTDHIIRY
jgi:hypothetical protein